MPDARLAYRPFAEQVAFFERKVNTPTERWDDLKLGDHAHGFMVAGAQRAALLDDLRGAVDRSIKQGLTFKQFQADFEDIVAKNGWTGWTGEGSARGRAWRARVIYDTNLRQSYNAGRYAQLTHPDMLAVRPFWQYRHNDRGVSKVPRPEHAAWHGRVLRADDPWWQTHYPSNGWGCKCGVRALGADDLERQGLTVQGAPTPADDTAGVDPGFNYNVGEAARSLPAAASYGQKVMQMPEAWRAVALADAQQRRVDWFGEWDSTLSRALSETAAGAPRPRRFAQPVGFLPPEVATALGPGGVAAAPSTALLGAVDTQLYHVLRSSKGAIDPLLQAAMQEIPQRLAAADTVVLWDKGAPGQRNAKPALVYAWALPDGRWLRLVFHVESGAGDKSMQRVGMKANWLRTAGIVDHYNLIEPKYQVLRGRL